MYFEETSDVYAAIAREKQLKAGSRAKKTQLADTMNPDWRDLFDDLVAWDGTNGDCFVAALLALTGRSDLL